jgi:hypothetical protein
VVHDVSRATTTIRTRSQPLAQLQEVGSAEANRLLVEWAHYLGSCSRPFGRQGWALVVDGRPVSVAVSASTVSAHLVGPEGRRFRRNELVELARLCSKSPWATRVMLRLWREVAAPAWPYRTPRAAVAYSRNTRHEGNTYRFDGWRKVTDRAGTSSGGGTWTRTRQAADPAAGPKTLWFWDLGEGA